MSSEIQATLQSWSLPVPVSCALVLAIVIYSRGWIHLRNSLPNIFAGWRWASFLGGVFSLWIAVGSPLAAFDEQSLIVHMLQHLLLMAVAPPLLLLGLPSQPLLHGLPQWFVRSVLGPVLRFPFLQWLGRALTNPALCWLLAMITLIAWHFPAAFEFALRSETWHEVEHACFFATSILFWWPVIQPWPSRERSPRWSIPLYLFLGMLANDAISAFLVFCDRVVYSSYETTSLLFGITPIEDQAIAGAIMWVFGTFIYLAPAVLITVQVLTPQPNRLRAF